MKRKITFMILFIISILLLNTRISFCADLPNLNKLISDLNITEETLSKAKNGSYIYSSYTHSIKTNVFPSIFNYKHKYDASSVDTLYNTSSRTYCISRGLGIDGVQGEYTIRGCLVISKSGIAYNWSSMGDTGDSYNDVDGKIFFLKWESLDSEMKDACKQIYYIINADDKYGKSYCNNSAEDGYEIKAECYKNDHDYFKANVSQRQYAIWMKINDINDIFANYFPLSDNNTKGNIIQGTCDLLNFPKNINVDKPVYIWFLKSETGAMFCQDLIIAGKKEETPPPPVTEYGSIKVIKKDSNCGHELSGAKVQVYDNTTRKYVQNGKELHVPVTINLIKGHSYTIYETGLPANHTCSSNGITYKYTTKTNKTVTLNTTGTMTVTLENNRTATNGKITFRKIDRNTGEGINGIAFDLHKEDNSYVGTAWSTTLNGEKGWVTFNNVSFGNYYVRETNNKSREQGYTVNPTNGTLGYTKNIGFKWTGIEVTAANPDVTYTDSFKNTEYGGLTIEKKDETTKELIKGAKITFKLYKKNRK